MIDFLSNFAFKTTRYQRLIALIACICSAGISHAFSIQDIPQYKVRYSVTFKNNSLGELEISIKKSSEHVVVRGETFPNALASLFGDGKVVETIEYKQIGDKLALSRLIEEKGANKEEVKKLTVDHQKNILKTHDDQYLLTNADQIDAYTFPLLSILGLNDSKAGKEEKLVRADSVRNFKYAKPVRERIKTQAGDFNTLKQRRTRSDNSKSIALWLTESDPVMPVKIEVERNGASEAVIELIEILN